jgi:hypothetical protein
MEVSFLGSCLSLACNDAPHHARRQQSLARSCPLGGHHQDKVLLIHWLTLSVRKISNSLLLFVQNLLHYRISALEIGQKKMA